MVSAEIDEIIELDRETDFYYIENSEDEEEDESLFNEKEAEEETANLAYLLWILEEKRQDRMHRTAAESQYEQSHSRERREKGASRVDVSQEEIDAAEKNLMELLQELTVEEEKESKKKSARFGSKAKPKSRSSKTKRKK